MNGLRLGMVATRIDRSEDLPGPLIMWKVIFLECAYVLCMTFDLGTTSSPFQDVLLDFTVQFLIEQGCHCQKKGFLSSSESSEGLKILS